MRRQVALALALTLVLCSPAGAAVSVGRITVATTATLIYTAPFGAPGRVLVRNPTAVSVYVGPPGVTTATGFEIAAGDSLGINLNPADTLFGVVAAATQVVYIISGATPQ